MLEKIFGNTLTIAAVAVLFAGVAFAGYQYREVHLPAFEELRITVTRQQCIQQCMDVCRANDVPMDRCNCSHCNVYNVVGIGGAGGCLSGEEDTQLAGVGAGLRPEEVNALSWLSLGGLSQ